MPLKKKRYFTKENSTKFLLYTKGRDAEGNKIDENVFVPVGKDYVPGSSLFFANLTGLSRQPSNSKTEDIFGTVESQPVGTSKCADFDNEKEANLEKILNQFEEEVSNSDREYENLRVKMQNLNFFDELKSSKYPETNMQIEIEEGSDFSDEFGQFSDADSDFDERKFKGPNYTLTSAKSDCPESMKMLNDGFEKILEEYDDNHIGPLDDEDICGTFSTENKHIQNLMYTPLERKEEEIELSDILKERILEYSEMEETKQIVEIPVKKSIEFDCESILSTYSNKYNHPVIIKAESKIRIPDNPLRKSLTKSRLKQLDTIESCSDSEGESDEFSMATSFNMRPKGETPEQRRERKILFKEAKRESRKLKKENKLAFKHEKKIQNSQAINVRNTMGIKLI